MRLSAALFMIPIACVASAAQATDPASQVRDVMKEMDEAAAALDADRFMSFYWRSPSLTITFDGQAMRGWDTILVEQRKWWSDKSAGIKFGEARPPEVAVQSRDVVTSVQWMSVATGDASKKPSQLVITSVWKKLAIGWRIVLAHESLVAGD